MKYPKISISNVENGSIHPIPKRKNVRSGSFVYPISLSINGYDKMYEHGLRYISEVYIDSYMLRCRYKKIDSKEFKRIQQGHLNDHAQLVRDIARCVRRIKRHEDMNNPQMFRLISEEYSAYLILTTAAEIDTRYLATLYIIDQKAKTMSSYMLLISLESSEGAELSNALHTGYFIASKYKDSDALADAFKYTGPEMPIDPELERILAYMMNEFVDQIDTKLEDYVYPEYTEFDRFVFQKTLEQIGAQISTHNIAMYHLMSNKNSAFDSWDNKMPESMIHNIDGNNVIMVEFTDKEWKYIDKYCEEHSILTSTECNLLPYFQNVQYSDYGLPILCESGKIYNLYSTYTIDEDNKLLRIYLRHQINVYASVLVSVDLQKIDAFNTENGLVSIHKDIVYSTPNVIYGSIDELNDISPLMNTDTSTIYSIARRLLKTLIMIHDRPERSRVIKCSRVIHYTSHLTTKQKNTGDKTTPKEVVWRVLKSVKHAKEFVRTMQAQGTRNVVYTMEEWPRSGHWRTYKSGKSIWIEPTTCNRHKPIQNQNKEISLKL